MSEATARPWRWMENPYAVGPLKGAHIRDVARTVTIADVLSRGGIGQGACEANAALIVKAVNAHDKLVEALELIQVETHDPAIERLCAVALEEAQR